MLQRHQKILELLAGKGNLSVMELSKLLDVSEVTIRTDLTNLAKQGKIARTHGGAQLIEERVRQEFTYQTRKSLNSNVKQRIGELAAGLINSLDSVIFDASTTVASLAHALKQRKELKDVTVLPTGIWTAIELMCCQNINILMPSGYLRHTTGSITGIPAKDFFSGLNIQKAFLGAWGISVERGLTDAHLLEVELKKNIVNHADEVIVLVDGSKFGQSGIAAYADVKQVSKIITDSSAPEEELEKIRSLGVEVLIA